LLQLKIPGFPPMSQIVERALPRNYAIGMAASLLRAGCERGEINLPQAALFRLFIAESTALARGQ
jgi:hypothetical protein